MPTNKTIGERMKLRREELNLSIREVAQRAGLSPSSIMRYERGEVDMGSDKVPPIARALHCTVAYLMGWEDEYYMDQNTLDMARRLFEDTELRLLFDAAADAKPADLKATYDLLLALKRREENLDGD